MPPGVGDNRHYCRHVHRVPESSASPTCAVACWPPDLVGVIILAFELPSISNRRQSDGGFEAAHRRAAASKVGVMLKSQSNEHVSRQQGRLPPSNGVHGGQLVGGSIGRNRGLARKLHAKKNFRKSQFFGFTCMGGHQYPLTRGFSQARLHRRLDRTAAVEAREYLCFSGDQEIGGLSLFAAKGLSE